MASKTDPERPKSRRDLLIGLGAVAAVAGGWQVWVNRPRAPAFEPIAGLPGWRQISFEGVSAPTGGLGGIALLGLDGSDEKLEKLPTGDLCAALFDKVDSRTVPVAVFSDFYCPFCRLLIERLEANPTDRISITWHELPLLGPASQIAARAAVAADQQGGYVPFQTRLMGSRFRPSQRFLAEVAVAAGLDAARLLNDMNSPLVATTLAKSRAASRTLGIWGTPAMVVGRTLVMGAISEDAMARLIALEAEAGPLPC